MQYVLYLSVRVHGLSATRLWLPVLYANEISLVLVTKNVMRSPIYIEKDMC